MNTRIKLLVPTCLVFMLLMGCSQTGTTITTDEVIVEAGQLDVRFSRGRPFANTYMLFGGTEMRQANSYIKVVLSGLDINTARDIHSRYPDFRQCKSPGAPLAQREVRDLQIVPASSKAMRNLKKALSAFKKSTDKDGEPACIKLEGEVITLTSVTVRELNQDITSQLPPTVYHEYYLVESAEVVDSQDLLESSIK